MAVKYDNVIFFDGDCNFCNSSVNFIFEHKKSNDIYFASLQSDYAKKTLPKEITSLKEFDTIYYYQDKKLHSKSTAILRMCKSLKFPFILLYLFIITPRFIRDFVYDIVSRNRHKIIKSKNTCRIPEENERKYFIDNE